MPWFIPQCSLTHWNAPNIRAKTILFNYHNKQNKTNKHKNVSPEENERLHSTMFWLKLNNSIWPQLFTRWYVPIVRINNTPARTSPLLIAFGLALITATAAGERESKKKKNANDRKPVPVLCWRCVEQNDDHVRHSPDSLADHTLISIHRECLEAARTSSACWARLIAHIGRDTVKPSVWTEGTPICLTMKREILLSPASDAPRAWRRGSNAGNAVTGFACDGKAGVFRFTSGAEIMHKLAAITVFIHYLSASINQLMLRPVK